MSAFASRGSGRRRTISGARWSGSWQMSRTATSSRRIRGARSRCISRSVSTMPRRPPCSSGTGATSTAANARLHLAMGTLDPETFPDRVQSYDEILAKSALVAGGVSKLFGLSFAFALLLAISGTYGLMARAIGMRTREIGVRRALGATEGSIQRLLLTQGGRQLGIGAVVALPLMLAGRRGILAGLSHRAARRNRGRDGGHCGNRRGGAGGDLGTDAARAQGLAARCAVAGVGGTGDGGQGMGVFDLRSLREAALNRAAMLRGSIREPRNRSGERTIAPWRSRSTRRSADNRRSLADARLRPPSVTSVTADGA